MKRIRSLFPRLMPILGLTTVAVVGMTIAMAQNQTEPRPGQPKTATKPRAEQPAPSANRSQPAAPQDDRPATEGQRTAPRSDRPAADGQGTPGTDRPIAEGQRSAGLGVQFQAQGDQGLQVTTVEQNNAFARAGLRQNDRIISVDGMTFHSPRQLEAFLYAQAGRPTSIIIDRGGQRYSVNLTLAAATADSGWLGVYLEEGEADTKGVKVTHVYPAGPAARAGLQTGDVIMQINNQEVAGASDVVMAIREFQPQAQVELAVVRDEENVKIPVVLGSRASVARHWNPEQRQSQYQPNPNQPQWPRNDHSQRSGDNYFDNVPPYAMQLEHDRRSAEQHERIEDEIRLLREEIQKLREQLEGKSNLKSKD